MNTEIESITTFLRQHLGHRPWRVLEAGCGSISHIPIPDDAHVVGIDISSRQLQRNVRLNEAILGDIQCLPLPAEGFDLIVCWDVLEHLPNPENALLNLFQALRPGGSILLAFPNIFSLKGMVTRLTPFFIHVWFYRYIIGDKRKQEHLDQFPTYLKLAMSPNNIRNLAIAHHLDVSYFLTYEGPVQRYLRSKNKLANLLFSAFEQICKYLTFRAWNPSLSDCIILLTKPQISQK